MKQVKQFLKFENFNHRKAVQFVVLTEFGLKE
jgi:hypothetical protein